VEVKTKFNVTDILWYAREQGEKHLELVEVEIMRIELNPELYYHIRRTAPHTNVEYKVQEHKLSKNQLDFIGMQLV